MRIAPINYHGHFINQNVLLNLTEIWYAIDYSYDTSNKWIEVIVI